MRTDVGPILRYDRAVLALWNTWVMMCSSYGVEHHMKKQLLFKAIVTTCIITKQQQRAEKGRPTEEEGTNDDGKKTWTKGGDSMELNWNEISLKISSDDGSGWIEMER
eukprot:NP_510729.1 Uncharacterized protein CELE_Y13C8A.1 [Caenorhabditis elegans]